MTRPTGVTILAIVAAINGVLLTVAGLGNLLNFRFPYIAELQQQMTGIGALIVGIGWLLLTWGFWSGQGWARMLGLIWAGVSILLGLWVLITELANLGTVIVPVLGAILIPIIVFWYLREEHVKAFFTR
jgi:hypothetical protein